MDKKALVLVLIGLSFIAIAVGLIASKEKTLRSGTAVLLETEPVDPRDLLRGDYVVLNYRISTIDTSAFPGKHLYRPGQAVYVGLVNDGHFWQAVSIASAKPGQGIFIRGKIRSFYGSRARIEYGLESYFVPEGEGRSIENMMREGNSSVAVEAVVDKEGSAVIRRLVTIEGASRPVRRNRTPSGGSRQPVEKPISREFQPTRTFSNAFFSDDFNDDDYLKDPAWGFVGKPGEMVVGIEGDSQIATQYWQVDQGVLCFRGNFDGMNFFSNDIDVPAGREQLVMDFDTALGGTWAYMNAVVLANSEGKTVFGGGVCIDNYNRSKGIQKTNNRLVIFDEEGEHSGELLDNSIAPGIMRHVRLIFDQGVVTVDYNNGQFTHSYKTRSSQLPGIKKILINGWQHTGGSMFDNIVVHQ